jgi:hypothetical protein
MTIEATEEDWKGDVRLMGKRNSLPLEPSAVEKKAGITRKKKFVLKIKRKTPPEPHIKDYAAIEL